MRKGVLIVVVLLLLFAVVDIGSKSFEQSELASASKSRSVGVGSVKVSFDGLPDKLSGFPYTLDVLADGKVRNATIDLQNVTASPLSMALVRVRVRDLELGRGAVLGSVRKVSGTGAVRVTVKLTPKNLADLLNTTVTLRSGYFHGIVNGAVIDGKVSVSGRQIVIDDGTHPQVKIDMPSKDYLPCTPTGVAVGSGGMVLSCNTDRLPNAVAKVVS